jgi:hypothetical protein
MAKKKLSRPAGTVSLNVNIQRTTMDAFRAACKVTDEKIKRGVTIALEDFILKSKISRGGVSCHRE